MKFHHFSVLVDDQAKALKFYTEVLGFVLKMDMPMGQYRWLTVAQTHEPDGMALLLEPNAHPAALAFQQKMFADRIPLASFLVDDIHQEVSRMQSLGVTFVEQPTVMGPVSVAMFDDTCGNHIQLIQKL
ncbi:MAG TPA: VOC family protein [Candidatus Solibacter sp.]|jgi:catechol 2,3-dioxygenase-like lactoylglutathione lyase family enzyme